jgi:hypothetical protein
MMQTTTETFPVQPIGSNVPSIVAHATNTEAARVVVQHIAGGVIFISTDVGDVTPSAGSAPTAKCFRLTVGAEKVFVLAPKQTLYAVGGGMMSVTVSGLIQY